MSELMKKRPTETGSYVHVFVPSDKRKVAEKALHKMGCEIIDESIPWRDAFSAEELSETGPDSNLRVMRQYREMTQKQLAAEANIPQRHISEMENGKRPIGKENAKRLAKALNIGYRLLL